MLQAKYKLSGFIFKLRMEKISDTLRSGVPAASLNYLITCN